MIYYNDSLNCRMISVITTLKISGAEVAQQRHGLAGRVVVVERVRVTPVKRIADHELFHVVVVP